MTVDALDALPRDGRRRPRCRGSARVFADAGIDALLVTQLPNVRYLTGFTGQPAMLLVTADDAACSSPTAATARRRASSSAAAGVDAPHRDRRHRRRAARGARRARSPPGARLGLEAHAVTWAQQRDFADAFAGARARRHRGRSSRGCAG